MVTHEYVFPRVDGRGAQIGNNVYGSINESFAMFRAYVACLIHMRHDSLIRNVTRAYL